MRKQEVKTDISQIIGNIKDKLSLNSSFSEAPYIPDIIEFCQSKRYLNLPNSGVFLFPIQKIILKCFYRGQRGNEHLKLTKEEMEILFNNKMDSIIDKYNSNDNFRELILVLGRRSGKGFLTSIIALYETMKLLELPGGSPFKYYNIVRGNPIYILTVATSSDQSKLLFNDIKAKMQTSEYFRSRIGHVEADRISMLTPEDKRMNIDLKNEKLEKAITKGSVVIMSGHSNSDALLGKRLFALLFDEVASFRSASGQNSGERIYAALGPCTADFSVVDPKTKERVLESKIVSISSPRSEEGIFYKLWSETPNNPSRIAFKLPTWKVNENITEIMLRSEYSYMSPNAFAMEFGAEFSGTAGERFVPEQYVIQAQLMGKEINLQQRHNGVPGMVYYAHLDPASTSHNYALVVVHAEERIRVKQNEHGVPKKEKFKLIVVDHVKVWHPEPNKSISVKEIDNYIIELARRFRFASVTYDDWNSLSSVQNLRAKGIPTRVTPFRKGYKMKIYDNLENLLVNNQLALPSKGLDAELLFNELKYLKRIYGNQGFRIKADEEAPTSTDDMADALAGACGQVLENVYGGYAKSGTVYTPQNRGEGQQWHIGNSTLMPQQWEFLNKKFNK